MSDGKFMLAKWSVAGEILERGVYFTISFCRHPIRYGRRRIGGGRDPFLFSFPPTSFTYIFSTHFRQFPIFPHIPSLPPGCCHPILPSLLFREKGRFLLAKRGREKGGRGDHKHSPFILPCIGPPSSSLRWSLGD